MSKLITVVLLLFSSWAWAGHLAGSFVITYEGVSGQPLKYEVTIKYFFKSTLITLPTSWQLKTESSCFSSFTTNLSKVGSSTQPTPVYGTEYCSSASSSYFEGLAVYSGIITLPSNCYDVTFSAVNGASDAAFFTNISFSYVGLYAYAKVNGTFGGAGNSSPNVPDKYIAQVACLGNNTSLYGFSELDGDSLYFVKATPKSSLGQLGTWSTGHSWLNPLGDSSSYTLDPYTGVVQASLANVGTFVIPIRYYEYRYDSTYASTILVGEGIYNLILAGTASCSAPSAISLHHEPFVDSDKLSCNEKKIRVMGSRRLSSSTITQSGSEFEVWSNKQGALVVSGASLLNDSTIEIELSQTLLTNDTLRIMANYGADSNVVISQCGVELEPYEDTLMFYTPLGSAPIANVSYRNNFLNVDFDGSQVVGDSILWYFGDGNTSDQFSLKHYYSKPGSYVVKALAYGVCGSIDSIEIIVDVCDSAAVSFSHNQGNNTTFFGIVQPDSATIYYWDFGDGQHALGDSVSHIYNSGMLYVATVHAVNHCGDTVSFSDTISTCLNTVVSWTYNLVSFSTSGMVIDFDGTASKNYVSFFWEFGDGGTDSTTLTPRHVYQSPGFHYKVSLTLIDSCGQKAIRAYRLKEIDSPEFSLDQRIKIYPNPAVDYLSIDSDDKSNHINSVSILDLSGREVLKYYTNNYQNEKIKISLHSIPKGQYITQVMINNGEAFRQLFIKE